MFNSTNDANCLVSADIEREVNRVIREQFGEDVEDVTIKARRDLEGDIQLLVEVMFAADTQEKKVSSGLFGLTGLIRRAMGSDLEGVFPVIRPVVHA